MDLRAKLLSNGAVPREQVTIPLGNGESVVVEVRGLSSAARGRLMTTSMVKVAGDDDEDGDGEERANLEKISPELVIECAYDPESGEKLFTEADRDAVGALAASFLDPIISTASRLSGLSSAAAKAAEGNSAKTTV